MCTAYNAIQEISKLLIVHAADVHLDAPLKGYRSYEHAEAQDEVRLATRKAFTNLITLCIEERADLLLLSGDLFDGEVDDFHTALFAYQQLSRLRDSNTRAIIVKGNHDAENVITRTLDVPRDNPFEVLGHRSAERRVFDDLGVAVTGQSYRTRHILQNLVAKFPQPEPHYFNIGVLHCDVDAPPSPDGREYARCSRADLAASGYDYWALGHIHSLRQICPATGKKLDGLEAIAPLILYPGNTQGRHIQETGPRGCVLVRVEGNHIVSPPEFRATDAVRWETLNVEVGACLAVTDVLDKMQAEARRLRSIVDRERAGGHPLIVRIEVNGITALHERLARNRAQFVASAVACVQGEGIWVERVAVNTCAPSKEIDQGISDFMTALEHEFDRLGTPDADISAIESELSPLTSMLNQYGVDSSTWNADRLRGLLVEAKSLVLSQLRTPQESEEEDLSSAVARNGGSHVD